MNLLVSTLYLDLTKTLKNTCLHCNMTNLYFQLLTLIFIDTHVCNKNHPISSNDWQTWWFCMLDIYLPYPGIIKCVFIAIGCELWYFSATWYPVHAWTCLNQPVTCKASGISSNLRNRPKRTAKSQGVRKILTPWTSINIHDGHYSTTERGRSSDMGWQPFMKQAKV